MGLLLDNSRLDEHGVSIRRGQAKVCGRVHRARAVPLHYGRHFPSKAALIIGCHRREKGIHLAKEPVPGEYYARLILGHRLGHGSGRWHARVVCSNESFYCGTVLRRQRGIQCHGPIEIDDIPEIDAVRIP